MKSRKLSAQCDLFYRLALEHAPADLKYIEIYFQKAGDSFRARSFLVDGYMMVPRPNTVRRLWIFLHECAHMKLHRGIPACRGDQDHARLEYEAEKYAFDVIKGAGIPCEKERIYSRDYIFGEIHYDVWAKGRHPDEEASEYATGDPHYFWPAWEKVMERKRAERQAQIVELGEAGYIAKLLNKSTVSM